MKRSNLFAALMAAAFLLTACAPAQNESADHSAPSQSAEPSAQAVEIALSDHGISVDGSSIASDPSAAVYAANDIVYYESGKDFTYGEGTEADAHSADEAAAHTVVHITQPGTYRLSGKLSKGQIAVDLGSDAKKDPSAVVTLVLNGVDITCDVAPAVIFYNVYECGSSDEETATKDVDTSAAGANVILADGTTNTVNGSYVARIYKPESVVLNEDGTEVEDAKKLHKYDGAFYSKMSMNINGDKEGTGILNINAENEGLDSELHLTINGGSIAIHSGNDGINTNEDNVSVTTVNGGDLTIIVTGETGEGDGIDSNGWLVINGGSVFAAACSNSADAGIDSDMGIHIGAGAHIIATGHMLDRIENAEQSYVVFQFSQPQSGTQQLKLRDANGTDVLTVAPQNDYSVLIYSGSGHKVGDYTLWSGDTQLAHGGEQGGKGFGPGMPMPGAWPTDMAPPEGFEGLEPPEGFEDMDFPQGKLPFDGMEPPEGGFSPDQMPPADGGRPDRSEKPGTSPERPALDGDPQELTTVFHFSEGANLFSGVTPAT